ncbi:MULTISPECIES: hypothetical protein [unclassified Streptomyces]|uniref:hypothetical protein n=1 Tax=unclassified Streptomyces TaxID=2593676 RepID=UPI00035CD475|nr:MULTISPECIES: hypothetical protein [unclassified Streptomyces]MYX32768.1 hypothetical protein [Streptomyces sp. SID8377]
MNCWCGHGPWNHYMYPCPPSHYPPPEYYGPASERLGASETDELTGFLRRLE